MKKIYHTIIILFILIITMYITTKLNNFILWIPKDYIILLLGTLLIVVVIFANHKEIIIKNKKGIQIIKNGSKFQMVSSPENAKIVGEFIKDETTGEVSRPSLETLTIIAYRGPISKIDLEGIS